MSGPATMNCRPTTTSAAPLPAPKLPGAPEGPLDLRAPLPLPTRSPRWPEQQEHVCALWLAWGVGSSRD
jgi:hypothetical protein